MDGPVRVPDIFPVLDAPMPQFMGAGATGVGMNAATGLPPPKFAVAVKLVEFAMSSIV